MSTETELIDGRFRVEQVVGSGGMGTVYRARDERSGRIVAVKVLDTRSETEVERARREAAILARLDHPAIVRYVAEGTTAAGQLYIAMDWIDGITVARRVDELGLTLRESLMIARGAADALAAAHAAGVLHRDVKPSNVLLEGGDPSRVRLIDFGIARVADPVRSLTRTGVAIGTPGYMSPEQVRGDRAITAASDVFGLGCMLYECATGQPAFSGTQATAVMIKILLAEPVPLARYRPEAPPALQAVLDRMLRKEAAQRFQSGAEVVHALDELGAVPDGSRRSARDSTGEVTAAQDAAPSCLVIAARGELGDVLPPPADDQQRALAAAAAAHAGTIEVLANGAVTGHFVGADAAVNAASCALAMREILPGWSIAIAGGDAEQRAETGTTLVGRAVMARIFETDDHAGAIVLDAGAASLLGDDFEIDLDRDVPTLAGRRAR